MQEPTNESPETPGFAIQPAISGGVLVRRRRRLPIVLALLLAVAAGAGLWLGAREAGPPASVAEADPAGAASPAAGGGEAPAAGGARPAPDGRSADVDAGPPAARPTLPEAEPETDEAARFAVDALVEPPLRSRFAKPPRAGIVFDVDTGEVLWSKDPYGKRAIASLTKIMTALIVAPAHEPADKVEISGRATRQAGSLVGVLPRGRRVRHQTLLAGLMMASGNDAAVALAEHHSGSVGAFIDEMNARARRMGLTCTRFSSPSGLRDQGNHSCPRDLAVLARAALADRRIARIVARRDASFPFPIKGGRLHLSNNNPLMRAGMKMTGLKTGYTSKAGRCYVMTQRRGSRHLGVVLLDSPDPVHQVRHLLRRGFRVARG